MAMNVNLIMRKLVLKKYKPFTLLVSLFLTLNVVNTQANDTINYVVFVLENNSNVDPILIKKALEQNHQYPTFLILLENDNCIQMVDDPVVNHVDTMFSHITNYYSINGINFDLTKFNFTKVLEQFRFQINSNEKHHYRNCTLSFILNSDQKRVLNQYSDTFYNLVNGFQILLNQKLLSNPHIITYSDKIDASSSNLTTIESLYNLKFITYEK